MATAERRDGREWKRIELQLDTAQILIVLAMLFGLCATSFYLGRWIERDRWSETTAKAAGAPKVVDSGAGDLTFFDTLGKGTAEPSRQVRTGASPAGPSAGAPGRPAAPSPGSAEAAEGSDVEPSTPAKPSGAGSSGAAAPAAAPSGSSRSAPTSGSSSAAGGAYAVQVFAGDRSQAERIASSLTHKGFAARVVGGSSAGTARVRVVGYRSKADAAAAASRLKREANLKPWVLKAD